MKHKFLKGLVCTAALSLMLVGGVQASSVGALLFTNQTSSATGWVGLTSNSVHVVGAVNSTSAYSVEFITYSAENSSGTANYLGSRVISPGSNDNYYLSKALSQDSVAKAVMYGNLMRNQKKDCIATVLVSNE